jgi:NAD(P)-dependent dehydrogenase (short-subunit alcohol dehydrogenase family)
MPKKILITGVSRGLGYELLRYFLKKGDKVYGLIRDKDDASRIKNKMNNKHFIPIIADINKDTCKKKIFNVLSKEDKPIDICINNAGIPGEATSIEDITPKEISLLFNTHCIGVMRVVQAMLPFLKEGGMIINVSSRLGSITNTSKGKYDHLTTSYSYRIAKAGQNMLTLSLYKELKDRMIIIGLHPGQIRTSSGSKDAALSPEEAAKKVASFIQKVKKSDSGKFFNEEHEKIPW